MAKNEEKKITTFELEETSIPQSFINAMAAENLTVDSQHVKEVLLTSFTAIGNYLRLAKHKETPAVFRVSNLNGDCLFCARISWDDETKNWDYETSFDNIADEGDDVCECTDMKCHTLFTSAWGQLYKRLIQKSEWISLMTIGAFNCLKRWIEENADTERKELVADKMFTATTEIIDGAVHSTIELAGDLLTLAKSDAED